MPKVTSKHVSDPNYIIQEFGRPKVWEYNQQKKAYFCKLCASFCEQGRKSLLKQHFDSAKHQKNLNLYESGKNPQQMMVNQALFESTNAIFAQDVCKAFISSNILLHKLNQPAIIELFQKHAKVVVPSRKTLTRLMEKESQSLLAEIKGKLKGKSLFLVVDEMTDCMGRTICAILVGPLDGSFL